MMWTFLCVSAYLLLMGLVLFMAHRQERARGYRAHRRAMRSIGGSLQ